MTEDFFKILTEHLKENKNPLDEELAKILDGAECELIEFKIGALFETKEKKYPYRAVFTTENYADYDSDVFDERLLDVCREIVSQTGVVIADVVVNEPLEEDSDLIDCEEYIHKSIQKNCAKDFNSGDYSDAALKALDILSDAVCDKDLSRNECVEILTGISRLMKIINDSNN
ncbi:MAG: hypothetical protein Q4Q53_07330 [Methanocorpusculum sp.]|nr:hypothetical protein [Methanocorpusculum sp.]